MNKLKRVIVEIDGKETEYGSLSECAKALGVSPAAVSECASSGWLCKGHVVRYADGTVSTGKRVKKETIKPKETDGTRRTRKAPRITAEDVNKLIARWYTKEWREYISSDALVSLIEYIKTNWKNMLNAES